MAFMDNGLKANAPHIDEEEATYLQAMLLSSYSLVSLTLKSIIELGVLEIIAGSGPGAQLSAEEILAQLPQPTVHPEAPRTLDRMLLFLASHNVLTCTLIPSGDNETRPTRRFGVAPVCRFLVKNKHGISLAPPTLMILDKAYVDSGHHLSDAVVEGSIPFQKANGMTLFEYSCKDPRFNKLFNEGLSNHSAITVNRLLENYKGFDGITALVDVGGGIGATLSMIISKYPHIKAICFDLPHVIADAPALPGIERVGGDMFAGIPTGGDAILLKCVLHNWSDEDCVKILKNCWVALPESGKVVVLEGILPEGAETSLEARNVLYLDICMLAYTGRGKERTKKEYESLAMKAGFSSFRLVCYAFGIWVMELQK